MKTYLLDTTACIALINGKPAAVRQRFARALTAGSRLVTSTIVAYELCYGVAKSARQAANKDRLETFLAGPIEIVPFDIDDAETAGYARAALERAGTPIGAYDVLIAGQALRLGATLVTANASEFGRVSGLTWANWGGTDRARR